MKQFFQEIINYWKGNIKINFNIRLVSFSEVRNYFFALCILKTLFSAYKKVYIFTIFDLFWIIAISFYFTFSVFLFFSFLPFLGFSFIFQICFCCIFPFTGLKILSFVILNFLTCILNSTDIESNNFTLFPNHTKTSNALPSSDISSDQCLDFTTFTVFLA